MKNPEDDYFRLKISKKDLKKIKTRNEFILFIFLSFPDNVDWKEVIPFFTKNQVAVAARGLEKRKIF